ncbi:MAG: NAD(P)H-dependent flavin oxidoreductase [Candidatus Rokuibacteriota bacterium]
MLRTRVTALLGIEHPIACGGMAGHTSPALAAAVSNGGGLGIHGCTFLSPEQIRGDAARIRELTDRPFGLNLLLCFAKEEQIRAVLEARPAALSTAWGDPAITTARARAAGLITIHQVHRVDEARRAAAAGIQAIVAQGMEGGGHVWHTATLPLVPQVADAVPDVPLLAAGGIADGRGVAAAMMLGADGVLMGTRFLATDEAPIHANYKKAILEADDTATIFTEVADIARQRPWPGAIGRAIRNPLIERWHGREDELRATGGAIGKVLEEAKREGRRDEAVMFAGQVAGLIQDIRPAANVVRDIAADAEALLRARTARLLA